MLISFLTLGGTVGSIFHILKGVSIKMSPFWCRQFNQFSVDNYYFGLHRNGKNLVCFEIYTSWGFQNTPKFPPLDKTQNSNCHLNIAEILQIKMGTFFLRHPLDGPHVLYINITTSQPQYLLIWSGSNHPVVSYQ